MQISWHLFLYLFSSIFLVSSSRYHAVITIDEGEKSISAHTQFTQGVKTIGPLDDANDSKPLSIEIDDLQAIKIVPIAKNFQQFAVTVGDRVLYWCRMIRPSTRSTSSITLMHLFLDNCKLKIAQSINSVCFDRRKHGTPRNSQNSQLSRTIQDTSPR